MHNKTKKPKNKSRKAGKKPNQSKRQKKSKLISKKMTFAEIMQKHPKAAMVLMEEGMHCVGCGMSMYETLEQGAAVHGLDADKLVEKINRGINKK